MEKIGFKNLLKNMYFALLQILCKVTSEMTIFCEPIKVKFVEVHSYQIVKVKWNPTELF